MRNKLLHLYLLASYVTLIIIGSGDYKECTYDVTEKDDEIWGYIHVAHMFLGYIIGRGGATKRRIEEDTHTSVTILKQDDSCVKVSGEDRDSVISALKRISSMVDKARQRSVFTHFLSIKTCSETIKNSFLKFKEAVLQECGSDYGVEDIVFQKDYKLHFTLTILVLGDQREITSMINIVTQFQEENEALFVTPLLLNVHGLHCFTDDHSQTRVLFAGVSECNDKDRLQNISDKMVDYLVTKRVILQREYDKVTLHMTLMNVSFHLNRGSDFNKASMQKNPPKTIDCTNIIKKFSNWDFGSIIIDEILLSSRKSHDSNLYYESVGSFKFRQDLSS